MLPYGDFPFTLIGITLKHPNLLELAKAMDECFMKFIENVVHMYKNRIYRPTKTIIQIILEDESTTCVCTLI